MAPFRPIDWFQRRVKQVKDNRYRVDPVPVAGVVAASPSERAIARVVGATTIHKPESEAQADLVGDIMFSMYQYEPKLKDDNLIRPDRKINKALVNWMMKNSEFGNNHATTMGNLPASIVSSTLLWESLTTEEALKDALEAQKKAEEEEQKAREAIQKMREALAKNQHDRAEQYRKEADQHHKKAEQLSQEGLEQIEGLQDDPLGQGMMTASMQKSTEAGEQVADLMAGWGIEPGGDNATDIQSVLELVNRTRDTLAEIAKKAGRYRQISAVAIERTRNSYTGAATEVKQTKDVMKMFPTERIYAFSPTSPMLFRLTKVSRYLSTGLTGWAKKSEGKAEGSFHAEVDGSGSMGGEAEVVAKAIALGMAQALRADKEANRHYTLATFGTQGERRLSVNDKQDWKEHIEWAEYMPGGGTDFDHALNSAMNNMEKMMQHGQRGVDLVFLTDGWANLNQSTKKRWLKFKADHDSRMFYINIGNGQNKEIEELADLFVSIRGARELEERGDEIVTQIVTKIIRAELEARKD